MTLLYFANCITLTLMPTTVVYNATKLLENKEHTLTRLAALSYVLCALFKMVLMATLLPDRDPSAFDLTQELASSAAEVLDLACMYGLMATSRKEGDIQVLSVGLGWNFADVFLRLGSAMFVGARGPAFDPRYLCMAVRANVHMADRLAAAALVWVHTRRKASHRALLIAKALLMSRFAMLVTLGYVRATSGQVSELGAAAAAAVCIGLLSKQLFAVVQPTAG
mmetsp:Transcript_9425/g.31928  ORF Transcript_9425/g.31928 Transcript_9425/m.31928 type:complete len:223 (-) Transcript_9425:240-908(-)